VHPEGPSLSCWQQGAGRSLASSCIHAGPQVRQQHSRETTQNRSLRPFQNPRCSRSDYRTQAQASPCSEIRFVTVPYVELLRRYGGVPLWVRIDNLKTEGRGTAMED
jgi:hypothetical protein